MRELRDLNKIKEIRKYFLERFGIFEHFFANYLFLEHFEKVFLLYKSKDFEKVNKSKLFGTPFMLLADFYKKIPANLALTFFKRNQIQKNWIEVDFVQAQEFMKGKNLDLKNIKKKSSVLSNGCVIVFFKDFIVGSGIMEKTEIKLNSGKE
ncbi:MAG: hypothetical protein Q7S92_06350 [Candidatus Diapherotrites archaeon]|nr:hypothetical protein [Candidatus Diapherotrites archaeon]